MSIKIEQPVEVTSFKDVLGRCHDNRQMAQVENAKYALLLLCGGNSSVTRDPEEIADLILGQIEDFIEVLNVIRP